MIFKRNFRYLFFLLAMLTSGCGAESQPMLDVLPSITPSITSTPQTVVPTSTPYQSPTPSPTIPTATLRPTLDPAGPTATSPIQPTYTLSPATQTATFLPTRIGLSVEYFITNVEQVAPGENITLFWRINGASEATIYRLDSAGERTRFWNVAGEGRITVATDPEELSEARFLVEAEVGNTSVSEELVISFGCPYTWYFQPPPATCPKDVPLPSFQVEQRFERGLMVWLQLSREIYVLYADDDLPAWESYPDTFEEGMPERDDSLIPPEGLSQPVRGFGLIWRENTEVRERLGWAVEGEVGYDGVIQLATGADDEDILYLRTRDGSIVVLQPGGDIWENLPAGTIPLEVTPTETATPG